jgi:hypothetical protein
MSAATMSGQDAVKAPTQPAKQPVKNSAAGKPLDTTRKQTASPVDNNQNQNR